MGGPTRGIHTWSASSALMVLGLALAVLTACSSAGPSPSAAATASSKSPTPQATEPSPAAPRAALGGWMAAWHDGIAFAQFGVLDTSLSGTINWLYVEGEYDHIPKTLAGELSGMVAGTNVTLSLNVTPWGSATWSGELATDRLTVTYQTASGEIGTFEFVPATVADYNREVESFNAAELEEFEAELEELERQAEMDAATRAASRELSTAATDLADNARALGNASADMRLWADEIAAAVSELQALLSEVRSAASERPMDELQQDYVCLVLADADSMRDEMDTLLQTLDEAETRYKSASIAHASHVDAVGTAISALTAAVEANPTGERPSYSQQDAADTLSGAEAGIESAEGEANEARSDASAAVESADELVEDARQVAAGVALC
jgi:hypothetical protein